jgi:hypothetical protein
MSLQFRACYSTELFVSHLYLMRNYGKPLKRYDH